MNDDLNSLHDWFKSNNVNKINYMLFTNNIETHPALGNLKIQIGNEELEQKKSVKFWGITVLGRITLYPLKIKYHKPYRTSKLSRTYCPNMC